MPLRWIKVNDPPFLVYPKGFKKSSHKLSFLKYLKILAEWAFDVFYIS